MSLLHKPRHIPLIFETGEKTATRRVWADTKARPNIGSVHIITTEYYQRREEAAGWVEILDVYQEPLGAMSAEDYDAEGGYTESEFKAIWRALHGHYDPEQVVDVVEYEPVLYRRDLQQAAAQARVLDFLLDHPHPDAIYRVWEPADRFGRAPPNRLGCDECAEMVRVD